MPEAQFIHDVRVCIRDVRYHNLVVPQMPTDLLVDVSRGCYLVGPNRLQAHAFACRSNDLLEDLQCVFVPHPIWTANRCIAVTDGADDKTSNRPRATSVRFARAHGFPLLRLTPDERGPGWAIRSNSSADMPSHSAMRRLTPLVFVPSSAIADKLLQFGRQPSNSRPIRYPTHELVAAGGDGQHRQRARPASYRLGAPVSKLCLWGGRPAYMRAAHSSPNRCSLWYSRPESPNDHPTGWSGTG
jgi:hypothetical protein